MSKLEDEGGASMHLPFPYVPGIFYGHGRDVKARWRKVAPKIQRAGSWRPLLENTEPVSLLDRPRRIWVTLTGDFFYGFFYGLGSPPHARSPEDEWSGGVCVQIYPCLYALGESCDRVPVARLLEECRDDFWLALGVATCPNFYQPVCLGPWGDNNLIGKILLARVLRWWPQLCQVAESLLDNWVPTVAIIDGVPRPPKGGELLGNWRIWGRKLAKLYVVATEKTDERQGPEEYRDYYNSLHSMFFDAGPMVARDMIQALLDRDGINGQENLVPLAEAAEARMREQWLAEEAANPKPCAPPAGGTGAEGPPGGIFAGEGWWYFVPYVEPVEDALKNLQEKEFNAGRYSPCMEMQEFPIPPGTPEPGRGHASIKAARAAAEYEGTRSILDIRGISKRPRTAWTTRVPDDELVEAYGTNRPTRAQVFEFGPKAGFIEMLGQGESVYFPVYEGGEPREWLFLGVPWD